MTMAAVDDRFAVEASFTNVQVVQSNAEQQVETSTSKRGSLMLSSR